jgi:predicted ATPase
MLKRWSIENFKSFSGRTDITLAPITIFAGANSSGKSTIIQSILLLKQTVQYAPPNRPMALNGPLVKLGTFDDIKNHKAGEPYIGIAWEMDVEENSQRYRSTGDLFTEQYFYFNRSSITSITGNFRWDATPAAKVGPLLNLTNADLLQLNPRIVSAELFAVSREEKEANRFALSLRRTENKLEVSEIDEASQTEIFGTKPECSILGASLQHFFPAAVAVSYNATLNRARMLAQLITGDEYSHHYQSRRDFYKFEIPGDQAREILTVLTGEHYAQSFSLFPELDSAITAQELAARFRKYRSQQRAQRSEVKQTRTMGELRAEISEILARGQAVSFETEPEFPSVLNEAVQYASSYFASSVRYLGPLRDEPKPIYPLEALSNTTEVGFKGEHTAAVLDLHREKQVRYLPSSFIRPGGFNLNSKYVSLHDAVVDWLTYVGVASEVSTADQGKMGHQLQVKTEGLDRYHDLTNVGVGVSQVLPIIVMALLADSPSMLIFEQPELHLHPKVQARLADFFLSVSLIGKQCLLETHSEYLIDRFRHRVANAVGDSLVETLKIYFTEREGGTTKCREVPVSQYGAISDWPKDFFEQSQIESESILRAAAAKRQLEKNSRKQT